MQPELLELIKDIALLLLGAGITGLTGVLVHKRDLKEEEKRWQRQLQKEESDKIDASVLRILALEADLILEDIRGTESDKNLLNIFRAAIETMPYDVPRSVKIEAQAMFNEKMLAKYDQLIEAEEAS